MTITSYNNLFKLIDDDKTFTEVGDPQNVLKTAAVMNLLMIVITVSTCMAPLPFVAPCAIIIYIITFCTLNIKYMRDFAMAVYQSDNLQIQSTKSKYDKSTNKTTDLKELVDEKLEKMYQDATNQDATLNDMYVNVFENSIKSLSLFNSAS